MHHASPPVKSFNPAPTTDPIAPIVAAPFCALATFSASTCASSASFLFERTLAKAPIPA